MIKKTKGGFLSAGKAGLDIAGLLVLILLLSFVSCGTDTPDDKTTDAADLTASETAADTEIKDSLPDGLDFQGEIINISVRGDSNTIIEFFAEENGEIVNDAIYARNIAVEERLNIKMNVIIGEKWQSYDRTLTSIRGSIAAGDQTYDLISGWSQMISPLSAEGLFLNLFELPYLDLSEPWWNKSIVKELSVKDKLYFAAGDINLTRMSSSLVVYENNKLREDYNLPNVYDAVFGGKWTFDYMHGLVKNIYQDLNGDGIHDNGDLYGALWDAGNYGTAFLASSNVTFTKKDADNIPYLDTDGEKLSALVDKTYDFLYNNEGVCLAGEAPGIEIFKNDRGYLAAGFLYFPEYYFRDMETEYSIIPFPKFDEAQEKYMILVQNGMSLLCVPVNNEKKEAVGAFIEAAASESYKSVTGTYFDVAMKVKYARAETSAKMLDIIREGANYSFAYIYNRIIGEPYSVMIDLMNAKKHDFSSWYEKNRPVIEKAIEKLVGQLLEEKIT